MQVTVRNKKSSLSERVGGCFVATACFGDESHPMVLVLRDFRDDCLRESSVGRDFIAWYYRNSPPLAAVIQSNKFLRLIGRGLLLPLAGLAAIAVIMKKK